MDERLRLARYHLHEVMRYLGGVMNDLDEVDPLLASAYVQCEKMADQIDPPGDCFEAKVIPFWPATMKAG